MVPSPSCSHRLKPYALPKKVSMGARCTPEAAAKFSPPPFAVIFADGSKHLLAAVGADRGWHRWNIAEFGGSCESMEVRLFWEEEKVPASFKKKTRLLLLHSSTGESREDLLARGLKALYPAACKSEGKPIPEWWLKPIYCGWGDQVAFSLATEGPGAECRALAYCIQGLYEKWVDTLLKAGVPIGTIIIDAGWSRAGVWKPNISQWPDLKGFIRKQHGRGLKVLLWIPTWLHEDLPEAWCVKAGGRILTSDPTHPRYLDFVRESVYNLLSGGAAGFDADGFKIDQLSYIPGRILLRGGEHFGRTFNLDKLPGKLKLHGRARGCELLYILQKAIYETAKKAKSDALINSSTVHPYFHDTFDMVRLHDTGKVSGDVMTAMKARSDLSRAALPHHPVDTDDWIPYDYKKWLGYTLESHSIGVPCIFYSEKFVLSMKRNPVIREIPAADLRLIASSWKKAGFGN